MYSVYVLDMELDNAFRYPEIYYKLILAINTFLSLRTSQALGS